MLRIWGNGLSMRTPKRPRVTWSPVCGRGGGRLWKRCEADQGLHSSDNQAANAVGEGNLAQPPQWWRKYDSARLPRFPPVGREKEAYLSRLLHFDNDRSWSPKWQKPDVEWISLDSEIFLQQKVLVQPHHHLKFYGSKKKKKCVANLLVLEQRRKSFSPDNRKKQFKMVWFQAQNTPCWYVRWLETSQNSWEPVNPLFPLNTWRISATVWSAQIRETADWKQQTKPTRLCKQFHFLSLNSFSPRIFQQFCINELFLSPRLVTNKGLDMQINWDILWGNNWHIEFICQVAGRWMSKIKQKKNMLLSLPIMFLQASCFVERKQEENLHNMTLSFKYSLSKY